jgi:heterotetrameric sarcosine oxidase delta subunit
MAFLITCPNCGARGIYEFRFGGEVAARPAADAPTDEWTSYFYFRRNVAGQQREWWYHKFGCRRWFVATRDTESNAVMETSWPQAPQG